MFYRINPNLLQNSYYERPSKEKLTFKSVSFYAFIIYISSYSKVLTYVSTLSIEKTLCLVKTVGSVKDTEKIR